MQADKEKLVLDNRGLTYMVAHEFKHCGIEFEDREAICLLGLVKAANAYNPEKSKFSTFGVRVIRNEMLMELRKLQKKTNCRRVPTMQKPKKEWSCWNSWLMGKTASAN